MSVKMMFKWYKAGKSFEEIGEVVDTSPKNVERLLRKYYPFLFDQDKEPLLFDDHVILVVDSSFNPKEEFNKSDAKIFSISDCSNCRSIYEKLSGIWRQPIKEKMIILDRIPTRFSWKDYRQFIELLDDSRFPIVLITEHPDKITKSINKIMQLEDIRVEKLIKSKDIKDLAKMILKEEDRDEVYSELLKCKQPWFWIIGWLREAITDLDDHTKSVYYNVLRFVDHHKFTLKKEYLLSLLAYSLFSVSQNPRLTFPLQWKKKTKKEAKEGNKRVVKKIKVKKKKTETPKKKKTPKKKAKTKELSYWGI